MNALNGTTARLRRLLPQSLEEAVPAVGVARRYERSSLRSDVIAGAIVAVARSRRPSRWASSPGLPVVFGLDATFLPLVGYAIFGSSRHLVVGPDATMATLTAAIVAPMATDHHDPIQLGTEYAVIVVAVLVAGGLVMRSFVSRVG